jgi:chromosome segregation ATPase
VLANTGEALNGLTATQAKMQDEAVQRSEQLRIRDQANQELDELQDGQLQQLSRQLGELAQRPPVPPALTEQVNEYGRAIDSINAFRKQINQEVLRLRERINALQLSVPGATPKAPAS